MSTRRNRNSINKFISSFLLLTFLSLFGNATVTTTWKGTVSSLWSDPNNWSNGLPNETTNVFIPWLPSSAYQPVVDIDIVIKKLTLNANPNVLTINENVELTVLEDIVIGNNATLDVGKGILTIIGDA
ncbi:MAG TPA: hypothetical protein P5250_02920 [Bacteroidales bacterium]|nr:hypothetical protein [Bacteroidales bacterium]